MIHSVYVSQPFPASTPGLAQQTHEQHGHGGRMRVRCGFSRIDFHSTRPIWLQLLLKCSSCLQQSVRLSFHFLEVSLSHQVHCIKPLPLRRSSPFFLPEYILILEMSFLPRLQCFYQNHHAWTYTITLFHPVLLLTEKLIL